MEDTIEEDEALVTNDFRSDPPQSPGSPSDKRRPRYSFEARKSIGSIIDSVSNKTPASNRSSTTIKAGNAIGGSGLSDDDFEEALKRFASERDSFLEDIQISAGHLRYEGEAAATKACTNHSG